MRIIELVWLDFPHPEPPRLGGESPLDFARDEGTRDLSSAREERQRPDLDAFARRRVRGRGWILEGGVEREARAAVLQAVEAFDQRRLVPLHARDVIPAVIGIVDPVEDLAGAVGVYEIGGDAVRRRE